MNCTPIPNTVLLSIVKLPDQIFSTTTEMVRCSEGFRTIEKFSPISGSFEQNMNTPSTLMSFVSPSTEPCGVSSMAGHLTRILGWSRLSIPILFFGGTASPPLPLFSLCFRLAPHRNRWGYRDGCEMVCSHLMSIQTNSPLSSRIHIFFLS